MTEPKPTRTPMQQTKPPSPTENGQPPPPSLEDLAATLMPDTQNPWELMHWVRDTFTDMQQRVPYLEPWTKLVQQRAAGERDALITEGKPIFDYKVGTPRKRLQELDWAKQHPPRAPTPNTAAMPANLTDLGNAQRFVERYGHAFRHARALGWLYYDGQRWARDATGAAMRAAKETVLALYADAAEELDDATRKALLSWAAKSESARSLANLLTVAETEAPLVVTPAQLDVNRADLNLQNGTCTLTPPPAAATEEPT